MRQRGCVYTKDGMLVSSAAKIVKNGPQEIEQFYQNLFKTSMDHIEITVDQVFSLGTESAIYLYLGEYHLAGEGQGGSLKVDGHFNLVSMRESITWKIGLVTAFPNPPPALGGAAAAATGPAR
jgi:ketosteroid isomerase-like protein